MGKMFSTAQVTKPDEVLAVVREVCIKYQQETLESVSATVKELRDELKLRDGLIGSMAFDTRTEEEKKNEQDEWRYRDYLGILTQLHQSGHNVHDELNDTLKRLQKLMFR